MCQMTVREDAVNDCKYALSLSETALNQHLWIWLEESLESEYVSDTNLIQEDREYILTLKEIKAKLYTDECLLTKEK